MTAPACTTPRDHSGRHQGLSVYLPRSPLISLPTAPAAIQRFTGNPFSRRYSLT